MYRAMFLCRLALTMTFAGVEGSTVFAEEEKQLDSTLFLAQGMDEAMAQKTEVGNTEDKRGSSTDDSPSSNLDFLLRTSVVVDKFTQRLAFHSSRTRHSATVLVASP